MGNYGEFLATDTAGLVAVSHVLDLTEDLEGVVHRGDHAVQAVSDELNLGVEGGVRRQVADGDWAESAELAQSGWDLFEEPNVKCIVYLTFVLFSLGRENSLDKDLADHFVALTADAFPGAPDIGDLMGSQTGLRVGNVLLLSVEMKRNISLV